MMRVPALRLACIGATLLLAAAAPGIAQDGAKSLLEWTPEAGPGPTLLEARASTAGNLLLPPFPISILSRYQEFEREFDGDFGVEGLTRDQNGDVLDELRLRLDARWGDATVYQWIERGLALYARFQASTQIRRKGFDMGVEMDDMAEGKLGVRVQRSLD
jgi:hypothetical protein